MGATRVQVPQARAWRDPPLRQAHMEAVHADWKEYLNLLICEESHLKYMEDYHQVPGRPAPAGGSPQGLWAHAWPPCCFLGSLAGRPSRASHCPLWARVCLLLARPLSVFPGGQGWRVNSPG